MIFALKVAFCVVGLVVGALLLAVGLLAYLDAKQTIDRG